MSDLPKYSQTTVEVLPTEGRTMDHPVKVICPRCSSPDIHAEKRGFSIGRAILLGGIGGFAGSNKLVLTCLSCGHRFKPGTLPEGPSKFTLNYPVLIIALLLILLVIIVRTQ